MNRIATVMKIQAKDKMLWIAVPWLFILLPSFLINVAIGLITRPEEGMVTGGLLSIFICMMVVGIISLAQSFPFALGFGIRRTDYFLGTSAMITLVSAATGAVLMLLSFVEGESGWGIGLHYFNLPFVSDGSVPEQWWVYFACMMHMFYLGFVISGVYRRFGRTGMLVLFAAVFVVISFLALLCTYYGWWKPVFFWLAGHTAAELATWLFAGSVVYALISYGMLRKTAVA